MNIVYFPLLVYIFQTLGLNSKNKMFDFARVNPLFSRGLNSKYLTPVMSFELTPQLKWVWHGRDMGVTGA
jgi:hypothetical protein